MVSRVVKIKQATLLNFQQVLEFNKIRVTIIENNRRRVFVTTTKIVFRQGKKVFLAEVTTATFCLLLKHVFPEIYVSLYSQNIFSWEWVCHRERYVIEYVRRRKKDEITLCCLHWSNTPGATTDGQHSKKEALNEEVWKPQNKNIGSKFWLLSFWYLKRSGWWTG